MMAIYDVEKIEVRYPRMADMFQRIRRYIAATSIITNLAQHGWIPRIVGP
jgi:hypothetical protein